jgi:ribonuclease J
VHGEYKQLKKHADLALGIGIAEENIHIPDIGACIALSGNAIRLEASVPSGKTLVDGLGIGDVGSVVLRDRQHLSQDGLVIVVATVDSVSGEVLSGPDIVSRGFVYVRENEDLIDDAKKCVNDVFYACWASGVRDWSSVKSRIREEVSQLLYRRTKRSPMVLPILMEV